jgi:RNA polymerase sigma-70 factor (ECF subfamily)
MSDISVLIRRWQAGDERAAEAIYDRCWESTLGLAFALLGDPADAEEAAQDALTYALTRIERYDPRRARFSTWLHTITVSRCRDRRRRRVLPSLPLLTWFKRGGDAPDPAPGPEHQAIWEATRTEVWQAIATLSPPLREAIVLRHWADFTYQEMGDMLDCSLRTAQSRVRLAHQRMRALLSQDDVTLLKEESR